MNPDYGYFNLENVFILATNNKYGEGKTIEPFSD